MNRLQAMHEAGIKASFIDDEEMEVHFSNGVVLPINAWLSPDHETEVEEPVQGGFAAFGNDETGYGYYPVLLVSEEEWDEERRAHTRAAVAARAEEARRQ